MLEITSLLTVGGAFAVLVASPGPATIAVAMYSMSKGRGPGFRFGLGLSFGHLFWGALAATGVGAILQSASVALVLLKVLGGVYLLWLALSAARAATNTSHLQPMTYADEKFFRRGLLLNLTNPKVVFAWTATLSLGTQADQSQVQLIVATFLCVTIAFVINSVFSLLFSTRRATSVYQLVGRWIQAGAAILFTVFGLGLIRSAIVRVP